MNSRIPEVEIDPTVINPRLESVHAAIEAAQNPGREGPFGLYDYSDYGDPVPHHVRDFRDCASPTYGDCIFKTTDRDLAVSVYERLTREHVAIAAIKATLRAFGLSPLAHESAAPTSEQREAGRCSPLYSKGDMQLVWVNSGDLHQHDMIPNPDDMGAIAARDRKKAGAN